VDQAQTEVRLAVGAITEETILRTVVGLLTLVFVAKIFAGISSRLKSPEVVGEILAGLAFGPYALGGAVHIFGGPLVEFNELVSAFALMGGLIVLFAVGLETTTTDLRTYAVPAFLVAFGGAMAPMVLGYGIPLYLGYDWKASLIVGAAMTATSLAVTARVLGEYGMMNSPEAKVLVNAAVIDDVLGLAVVGVVLAGVAAGVPPTPLEFVLALGNALLIWLILFLAGLLVIPWFIRFAALWRSKGTIEAAATATCFGMSAAAAFANLSPIVGAVAAGMALGHSKAIARIREFTEELLLIFGPIFFAVSGALIRPSALLHLDFLFFLVVLVIAVSGKLLGCGIPAHIYFKDRSKALLVGFGMVSRGELGLVVAALGLTNGLITPEMYAALLTVILITTIITPIILSRLITA
jgi:Kef-type K+ transport system membrane component KefB